LVAAKALDPADAAKVVEAEGNIKIAEAARDKISAEDGAVENNKIILDVDTKQAAADKAIVDASKAVASCVP